MLLLNWDGPVTTEGGHQLCVDDCWCRRTRWPKAGGLPVDQTAEIGIFDPSP